MDSLSLFLYPNIYLTFSLFKREIIQYVMLMEYCFYWLLVTLALQSNVSCPSMWYQDVLSCKSHISVPIMSQKRFWLFRPISNDFRTTSIPFNTNIIGFGYLALLAFTIITSAHCLIDTDMDWYWYWHLGHNDIDFSLWWRFCGSTKLFSFISEVLERIKQTDFKWRDTTGDLIDQKWSNAQSQLQQLQPNLTSNTITRNQLFLTLLRF